MFGENHSISASFTELLHGLPLCQQALFVLDWPALWSYGNGDYNLCIETCRWSRILRNMHDHLPVSMPRLLKEKLYLENYILCVSGIHKNFWEKYTECTSKVVLIFRHVTNLPLFKLVLICDNYCSTNMVLSTLSMYGDNPESKVFARCRAKIQGSCWSLGLTSISLRKIQCWVWMTKYIHIMLWDAIIHPFPNFTAA